MLAICGYPIAAFFCAACDRRARTSEATSSPQLTSAPVSGWPWCVILHSPEPRIKQGPLAPPPKQKGPPEGAPFALSRSLLQRTTNRTELVVQRRTEVIDDGNNRQRDTCSNKPILNGGSTVFICDKTLNQSHFLCPCLGLIVPQSLRGTFLNLVNRLASFLLNAACLPTPKSFRSPDPNPLDKFL
jgi:hypothetical protein